MASNNLESIKARLRAVASIHRDQVTRPRLPSRSFRRHAARLRGRKALTKTEINALCWTLNGRKASACTEEERRQLIELVDDRDERPLTKEQTALGIDWLRRLAFKKSGEARKRCPFGAREQAVIRSFKRFAWIGLTNIGTTHWGHDWRPIWRVFGANGDYFDYYVCGGYGGVEITVCG